MNEARMFAAGRLRIPIEPMRTLKLDDSFVTVFIPLGFAPGPSRTLIPTYPPGLPVHFLLAAMIGGWTSAPVYVVPLAALGCLLLMFAVGRELDLPPLLALAAAAILAAVPQFLMHAVQPMSDVMATFWALMAIWCALRSRRQPWFAVAAGMAFAVGVWVRPTSALMALPMALALRSHLRPLLRAAAGALPLIIVLIVYQKAMYGSPLKTGYGSLGDVVSLAHFGDAFRHYSVWMARTLTPLVFPGGLLIVFDRRRSVRHRALLAVWFGAFFLFYCCWSVFDAWWYTRFLLPGTPALIFASLLLLQDGMKTAPAVRWPAVTRAIAALLVVILIAVPARFARRYHVLNIARDQSIYPGSMLWAAPLLPGNALVVSGLLSGCFFHYTGRFTVRWDQLDNDRFQLLRAYAGNAGLQWYAVLSAVEVDMDEFRHRLHGRWTPVATYRNITLYRLDS
jgi:4-amino-4-deoxy-L-arabinose transferase-like glycosyltransferase